MRVPEAGMVGPLAPGEIKARLHDLIGYDARAEELSQIAALLAALSPLAVEDPILAEPATTYRAHAEREA